MKSITSKKEVKHIVSVLLTTFQGQDISIFIAELERQLLAAKVKFPLLEYAASELYHNIPIDSHIEICDRIAELKAEGGNVLLGILLQKHLEIDLQRSVSKAVQYIGDAVEWYVPDIIGERVFGWGLLHFPTNMFTFYLQLKDHPNHWVVRSLGAGAHYAVKKGLSGDVLEDLFAMLLSLSDQKHYQIRTGIGWAAKTMAKFHPEVIDKYRSELDNIRDDSKWFIKKVDMGLNRNTYAKRNRG